MMQEKIMTKEEIMKELEKCLDLYSDKEIIGCGFSMFLKFKDYDFVTINKNYYNGGTGVAFPVNHYV